MTLPTIIGRIPIQLGNITPADLAPSALTGCLRNLVINGEYQDFSEPLYQQHVETGCAFTDSNCNTDLCHNGGVCKGEWAGFDCVCPTDFKGDSCQEGV